MNVNFWASGLGEAFALWGSEGFSFDEYFGYMSLLGTAPTQQQLDNNYNVVIYSP